MLFGVLAVGLLLVSTGSALAQDEPQAAVDIVQYQFQPTELVVMVGTTVTWTNLDAAAHTVTADDGAWSSDLISRHAQWGMTFDTQGEYGYYCVPHGSPGSGMIGTVVVIGPDEESKLQPPPAAPVEQAQPDEAPPK
jgi:plastocyanin